MTVNLTVSCPSIKPRDRRKVVCNMSKWKILLIVVLVVLCGLVWSRDWIIHAASERALSRALGAPVEVDAVQSRLFGSNVELQGIRFLNPEGFPEGTALEVDRIFVRYRWASLASRIIRLPRVELDVGRVVVVTDERGKMNVNEFPALQQVRLPVPSPTATMPPPEQPAAPREVSAPEAKPVASRDKPPREAQVDTLVFRLRELEMRDYSRDPVSPKVRTYRLNYERSFEDVRDPQAVVQALSMDLAFALGPQLLRDVASDSGVDLQDLMDTVVGHEGDLEELGRKLDEQTKDLQRELRRQLRGLREGL